MVKRKEIDLKELGQKFINGIPVKVLGRYFNVSPATLMSRLKEINISFLDVKKEIPNLDGEIWKDIIDFPTHQVSNKGRVKCKNRFVDNSVMKQFWHEKLMSTCVNKDGYYDVSIRINKTRICRRVHRLVGFAFVKGYFEGAVINHLDGNKLNNNDWNLEWTTPLGNHKHAIETGLDKGIVGENNPNVKLNFIQVNEIRESNLSSGELITKYGVCKTTIHSIKNNKTWQQKDSTEKNQGSGT